MSPTTDHATLPRHPFYTDAPPQSAHIPMIIGNTRDETRAFLGNEPGVHELSWEELPQRLLPQLHVDISPEYVISEYRRLYPDYSASEVFFAATTAGRSWRGAVIEAELRAAQGSPVFAYQLNYRSPLEGGRYGAMHTMDIPLVFDNVGTPNIFYWNRNADSAWRAKGGPGKWTFTSLGAGGRSMQVARSSSGLLTRSARR